MNGTVEMSDTLTYLHTPLHNAGGMNGMFLHVGSIHLDELFNLDSLVVFRRKAMSWLLTRFSPNVLT